jgi:hypothetical protein
MLGVFRDSAQLEVRVRVIRAKNIRKMRVFLGDDVVGDDDCYSGSGFPFFLNSPN